MALCAVQTPYLRFFILLLLDAMRATSRDSLAAVYKASATCIYICELVTDAPRGRAKFSLRLILNVSSSADRDIMGAAEISGRAGL